MLKQWMVLRGKRSRRRLEYIGNSVRCNSVSQISPRTDSSEREGDTQLSYFLNVREGYTPLFHQEGVKQFHFLFDTFPNVLTGSYLPHLRTIQGLLKSGKLEYPSATPQRL